MWIPVAFFLWILHCQVVLSIAPSTLTALAHVQSQKAKAIANAVNLHAKAKHNAVLRKSRVHRAKLAKSRKARDLAEPPEDLVPHLEDISFDNEDSFDLRPGPPSDEDFDQDERIGESVPQSIWEKQRLSGPEQSKQEPTKLQIPFDGEQISGAKDKTSGYVTGGSKALLSDIENAQSPTRGDDKLGQPHLFEKLFHKGKFAHDKTPSVNINIDPNVLPHTTTVVHEDKPPQTTVVHHTSIQPQPNVIHEILDESPGFHHPSPTEEVFHHTIVPPPTTVVHHTGGQPQPNVIHEILDESPGLHHPSPTEEVFHHTNVPSQTTVVHHTSTQPQPNVIHEILPGFHHAPPTEEVFHHTNLQPPPPPVFHHTNVGPPPHTTVTQITEVNPPPSVHHSGQPTSHHGGVSLHNIPDFGGGHHMDPFDENSVHRFDGFYDDYFNSHYYNPHEHPPHFMRSVHQNDYVGPNPQQRRDLLGHVNRENGEVDQKEFPEPSYGPPENQKGFLRYPNPQSTYGPPFTSNILGQVHFENGPVNQKDSLGYPNSQGAYGPPANQKEFLRYPNPQSTYAPPTRSDVLGQINLEDGLENQNDFLRYPNPESFYGPPANQKNLLGYPNPQPSYGPPVRSDVWGRVNFENGPVNHNEFLGYHNPESMYGPAANQKGFLGYPNPQPSFGPPVRSDVLGDVPVNQKGFPQLPDDDRLGTFQLPSLDVKFPDLSEYYDPYQPQNKQPIVKYIEDEQKTFNKLMKFMRGITEKLKSHKPLYLPDLKPVEPDEPSYGYERNTNNGETRKDTKSQARDAETNEIDGNGGTGELTPAMQQKAFEDFFQLERSTFEKNLHMLQQEHQDNLDMLMNSLNLSPFGPINLVGESQTTPEEDRLGNLLQFDDERATWKKFSEQNERSESNSLLGRLFDVPLNTPYEYLRSSRSLNQTKHDLEKVIAKERDIVNKIMKHAKHDEDLMMVGYIGDSLLKEIEGKRNKSTRAKRDLYEDPVRRLFTDPVSKLDMPRTIDNLGAVARSTFEHETTPMYHVRNLVGSAKDAVVAAMRIPNQSFITPSKYDIVERQNDKLGDINTAMLSENSDDVMTKTFHKVGTAVRESVKSGQMAVNHIGELAEHGKKAINTLQHTTPRLILPEKTARTAGSSQKAILVVPRILEVADESEQVGAADTGDFEQDYVKLGNVFDAIGVSDPNTEVDFRRIALDTRAPSMFGDGRLPFDRDSDSALGATLDSLQDAQISVGAITLRDFFEIIKREIRDAVRQEVSRGYLREQNGKKYQEVKTSDIATYPKTDGSNTKPTITQPQSKDNETLGSFIPEYLQHPFMNQATPEQLKRFSEEHSFRHQPLLTTANQGEPDHEEDPIVGAINPLMFHRLFDEALKITDHTKTAQDATTAHQFFTRNKGEEDASQADKDNHKVATSMILSKEMLKPFMGQATKKNIKDFLDMYKPKKEKKPEKEGQDKYEEIIFEPVDNIYNTDEIEY